MKKTEVKQVVIEPDRSGQRIDNFLQRELDGIPRSRIYQMLRKGEVRVNKGRIKQTYRLQAGDTVRIPPLYVEDAKSGPVVSTKLADKLLGSILFEDDSIIVLNKPSGMSVHSGTGQKLGVIEAIRASGPAFEKLRNSPCCRIRSPFRQDISISTKIRNDPDFVCDQYGPQEGV